MKYSTILFDLDGTLTDPKIGITKSVQYALAKYGIHEDNLDKLEPFIGPPLVQSFMEFYSFTELEAKQAVDYYREYFSETGIFENERYEGIIELLDVLVRDGRTLIVATSKPTIYAKQIADHFELSPYFDLVCGSNLDGTMTAKGEIIQSIMNEKKLDRRQVVMVGDRKHDIIGAQLNKIDSIGVGYGYGLEEELRGIGPTFYVESVIQLHKLLLG
ncbi:HAD family hydrolase [Paenibacillus sp. 1011MAR3C5]|uniref:HAD family hydrolase n=1 Tax=Paenibacillus sp. 1011MAR3C5 TaxID=1675787 RepID=UPI000E6C15FF|nr:HAD family hydrolase [Paenibacillus sp. 1011MAR3C5]RJE90267.1 HAD family hydrolase [Paenibacillus sp. 1011MAR3C5]